MKKITLLKSLFVVLALSFFSLSAWGAEKTISFKVSDYPAGTQYATEKEHKIDDVLTLYTTDCHFTTQLRIYSSPTNNGYVVSNKLPGAITAMTFNAGNKEDNLLIFGSNDGASWTQMGSVDVTSTAYRDYSVTLSGNYTYFKLDVEGTNQIRIASMSVTYDDAISGGEGGDVVEPDPEEPTPDPEEPEIVDDGTIFLANFNGEGENNKGTNSYTGEKQYTVSGVKFNLTYAESAITGSPLEGVGHIIARVAKNTTNTPTIVTEAVTVKGSTITNIGFIYKAKNEGATMNVYTSPASGAEMWTSIYSIKPTTTLSRVDLPVSLVDDIKLKFEWVTTSTTKDHRDYYLDSIYVKGTKPEGLVEKPVISPTSKDAVDPVEVTITAAAGEIRYTLNGEIPTAESTLYTAPFIVSTTTTVKAIAIVEGRLSDVTEVTYTFPIDVENIAEWITTATENQTTNVRITGTVSVTHQTEDNLFVQDASGALLIFGYNVPSFNVGDQLTGIIGKYGIYNGKLELVSPILSEAVAGSVSPKIMNIGDIKANNLSAYVEVEATLLSDVTFVEGSATNATLVDGENTIVARSSYKQLATTFTANTKVKVVGIVDLYNGTPQIAIISIEKVVAPVAPANPVIAIEEGVVTFSCETEGAKIMYAFVENGEELTDAMYQEYTGEISINNGSYTVYAYAVNGTLKSEVVSMRIKVDNGVAVGAEVVAIAEIFVQNRTIVTEGEFQIYTVTGQNVTEMNGALANGVYVVRSANAIAKVVVR